MFKKQYSGKSSRLRAFLFSQFFIMVDFHALPAALCKHKLTCRLMDSCRLLFIVIIWVY